ncbi:MAG TPA: hypothetical protein VH682_19425 [Gemmataceae bacterium]
MTNDTLPHRLPEVPEVTLIIHPPDKRRGHLSVPAQAGPCCCTCCCCCLHSLGGIIGAAVAPNMGSAAKPSGSKANWDLLLAHYWEEIEEPGPLGPAREGITATREGITAGAPAAPAEPRPVQQPIVLPGRGLSAVSLFWWISLILGFGVVLWFSVSASRGGLLLGAFILVIFLPAVQLGAALLTAIILAVSAGPHKSYQFQQLGKIGCGVVVGTVVGVLVMVVLGWAFLH